MFITSMRIKEILPPFDFNLFVGLYSSYKFEELVDVVNEDRYYRVIYLKNNLPVLLIISSSGSVDSPLLNLRIYSKSKLRRSDLDYIRQKIQWMLGLNDELKKFYNHMSNFDPVLYKITQKLIGLRAPATATVFEAVIHALIEQQISFNFAGKIKSRLVRKFGKTINIDGKTYYAFPTPKDLLQTTPEELRMLQLSRRKGEYIINIASKVASGEVNLESLVHESKETVVEKLSKFRGLGKWTAEMVMVRGMRKLDAVPADDIALQRLISHYYYGNKKISKEDTLKVTENRWGKYRGYAAFYLMYWSRVTGFLK